MRVQVSPRGGRPGENVQTIEDAGMVAVFVQGLRISVQGNSVYVSTTEVDEGGPQRLITDIHNVNSMQTAMSFRAVDGTGYHELTKGTGV